jgi:hypothetical protein
MLLTADRMSPRFDNELREPGRWPRLARFPLHRKESRHEIDFLVKKQNPPATASLGLLVAATDVCCRINVDRVRASSKPIHTNNPQHHHGNCGAVHHRVNHVAQHGAEVADVDQPAHILGFGERLMKCPIGCTCGKHHQHHRDRSHPTPRNVTAVLTNPAERLQSTFGDEQRARVRRAADERHQKGIIWRGTPSENFDWDRAIAHMRKCLEGVG